MPSHYKRLDAKIAGALETAKAATTKEEVDAVAGALSAIVDGVKTTPPKDPWTLIKPKQVVKIREILTIDLPAFKKAIDERPAVEAPAEA